MSMEGIIMQGFYNSLFFLNYLCSYGLNLNDNPNILELFQSAGCSLSQHLVNNNQFLLSNKVTETLSQVLYALSW